MTDRQLLEAIAASLADAIAKLGDLENSPTIGSGALTQVQAAKTQCEAVRAKVVKAAANRLVDERTAEKNAADSALTAAQNALAALP